MAEAMLYIKQEMIAANALPALQDSSVSSVSFHAELHMGTQLHIFLPTCT
jgi:hypothetical protein